MGSTGGGGFYERSIPREEKEARLRFLQNMLDKQFRDEQYEVQVGSVLSDALVDFNNRPHGPINQHLQTIKDAIASDIEGTIDLRFGGSVAKHTYVNGLSDVDTLVVVNKSDLMGDKPDAIKEFLRSRLKERLPITDISVGRLAVTVRFADVEVQLLPAVKTAEGYKIPNATGTGWKRIEPRAFTEILTKANDESGGQLIPTIKLAKAVMDTLPENRRIGGYHSEAMAIEVFRNYQGERTPKAMLPYYFQEAEKRVRQPMKDITGQSEFLDADLKEAHSFQRKLIADSFSTVERKIRAADAAKSIDQWKEILGLGVDK